MKILVFIIGIFKKQNKRSKPFAEAVSEGIKDTFREMGYRIDDRKAVPGNKHLPNET
ncbi:MAG: hypothetical protein QM737_03000 [Ferruginibacter sp.]